MAALLLTMLLVGIFVSPPRFAGTLLRISGIAGALCLVIVATSSAFVKEIFKATHRPFRQVHHWLALSGGFLILLHPLLLAWQMNSLSVFVPVTSSWSDFLTWGGRAGLILFFLAAVAAFMMKKIPAVWRQFHWLMYPALLLGGIHALRKGQDMTSVAAKIAVWILLILITTLFVYKRLHKPSPVKNKGAG